MLRNLLARSNTTQRSVLVATILSRFFASLLTWDLVINREKFGEGSPLTAIFISRFDALGLLISFVISIFLISLPAWIIWVRSSKGKIFSIGVCMMMFVLSLFDLANNLMMFRFGSSPLFTEPFIFVQVFLAILLVLSQARRAWGKVYF